MVSPWARYVTLAPYHLSFTYKAGLLIVVASQREDSHDWTVFGGPQTRRVGISNASGQLADDRTPVRARLDSWAEPSVPTLWLHPMALVHLFAAGQITESDIRRIVDDTADRPTRAELRTHTRCGLLNMLHRTSCVLDISTIWDLQVT